MDSTIDPIFKPTKAQLQAAKRKGVPDLIAPRLKLLFAGINPGLYSAATGHHFARPGNRFWPALFAGGFTDRVLSPFEEPELLRLRIGITNIVARTTATADQLSRDELLRGANILESKVRRFRPQFVAIVGVGAYRVAFQAPKAQLGKQPEKIAGAIAWVLPNPSGLNAHYQPRDLAKLFGELREAVERR